MVHVTQKKQTLATIWKPNQFVNSKTVSLFKNGNRLSGNLLGSHISTHICSCIFFTVVDSMNKYCMSCVVVLRFFNMFYGLF